MANEGPTPLERFINGILPENPIYRQLLGMCPTLAVTAAMKPAMTMVAATAFVLICANILTSLIRPLLKPHLRILVFTLTIATFVTIADRVLQAFLWDMSKELGPYVPLIIVNCIIISRCEICASKQGLGTAIADALGMSIGFMIALGSVATVREVLGMGTWFEMAVLPSGAEVVDQATNTVAWLGMTMKKWPALGLFVMPPGAFLTLGFLLAGVNWIGSIRAKRAASN